MSSCQGFVYTSAHGGQWTGADRGARAADGRHGGTPQGLGEALRPAPALAHELGLPADGLAAAEAARTALEEPVLGGGSLSGTAAELRSALEVYDDAAAQSALDVLLATFTFETVAREVMLPLLREVGERWERGEISVAQEHFASSLLRGRLLSIARGWDRGVGPRSATS